MIGPGEDVGKETIHRAKNRPGVQCAWVEKLFVDPQEGKEARSRIMIIRGNNAHAS